MTIEKLFKPLKGIATGLAMLALGACGDGGSSNKVNITTVPNFGNGYSGQVTWDVMAEGSKKPVEYVDVSINGKPWQRYPNTLESNPLEIGYVAKIKKENAIDVYAGNAHESDAFVPASEVEAENLITEKLNTKSYPYMVNSLVTIGENCSQYSQDTFYVDYDIDISPAPTNHAIIEYVSTTDDIHEKLADKQKLDCAGIPNKYFVYLPESEVRDRTQSFINNNWQ